MRVLIAMDKFKGSLSAWEACRAVQRGIGSVYPDLPTLCRPMADGGEGTARELMTALGGSWIPVDGITGPLPRMKVEGGFVWFPATRTALVEMATVNGLTLLHKSQRNPLETTTYGTGQLIGAAADHGAEKILLCLGGSATVDGGVGAAMALGWKFLGTDGGSVPLGGKGLALISDLDGSQARNLPPLQVLCDVDNPLCGPEGAARVFGPQKGATPAMVDELEDGMANLGRLVGAQLSKAIVDRPGAGASGGLAGGAAAFLGAELVSGIETFMDLTGFEGQLAHARFVVTGEGCFDDQSLHGKVVAGVCSLAHPAGIPVGVLAGRVEVEPFRYQQFGVVDAIALKEPGMSQAEALRNAESLLVQAAAELARRHFGSEPPDA